MVRKIALGILLTVVAGAASARTSSGGLSCKTEYFWGIFRYESCTIEKKNPAPVAAPEINAASAVAGLTLMIGGLAVLRGRRSKGAKA
jgi:hypothetical protein